MNKLAIRILLTFAAVFFLSAQAQAFPRRPVALFGNQKYLVMVDTAGEVWTYQIKTRIWHELTTLSGKNVIHFACGKNHCLALTRDGGVYSWGSNSDGQLGLSINDEYIHEPTWVNSLEHINIVDLTAGYAFSAALAEDGTLYTWGYNAHGQLGQGHTNQINLPRPIAKHRFVRIFESNGTFMAAIDANQQVYIWGNWGGTRIHPTLLRNLPNIVWGHMQFDQMMALDSRGRILITRFDNGHIQIPLCNHQWTNIAVKRGYGLPYLISEEGTCFSLEDIEADTLLVRERNEEWLQNVNYIIREDILMGSDMNSARVFATTEIMVYHDGRVVARDENGESNELERRTPVNMLWSPQNHRFFSSNIQQGILTFLLCLQRMQNTFFLRVPKVIKYLILSQIGHLHGLQGIFNRRENNGGCNLF